MPRKNKSSITNEGEEEENFKLYILTESPTKVSYILEKLRLLVSWGTCFRVICTRTKERKTWCQLIGLFHQKVNPHHHIGKIYLQQIIGHCSISVFDESQNVLHIWSTGLIELKVLFLILVLGGFYPENFKKTQNATMQLYKVTKTDLE